MLFYQGGRSTKGGHTVLSTLPRSTLDMNYEGKPEFQFGGGNLKLDPSVIAGKSSASQEAVRLIRPLTCRTELPTGCQIISTDGHGVSFWARTGRIDVRLVDGSIVVFFIKVLTGDVGMNMVRSEMESMQSIYKVKPDFAPKPLAWGTYQSDSNTHFFLCEFRDILDDTMPDPARFTRHLADLHGSSISPTGKFGYHTQTWSGNLPQMVEWDDSWESFFTKNFRFALDLEIQAKGYDPEFDVLLPQIFEKVIPRLLRPLESDGRSVKPSLVHGDLWFANSGTDSETDGPLVFDACCLYAHNECKCTIDITVTHCANGADIFVLRR